jgi:hypothetical protein
MNQFMQRAFLTTLAAATLHAAAIRGTVVENQTGYPLARATVMIETMQNSSDPKSVRTNLSGIFEFAGLPAGTYRISAAKAGFAPVAYGQKRWFSPGMPIALAADDTADLTIRMPRYGGISGAVFDENDVGLPEHEVGVYTSTRPPRLLAHAPTDDRGVYRLGSLRPGKYRIRSLAKSYDDESYLPTFYRDSPLADEAHAIEVKLDEEVEHMDFHPATGRLFTVSGRINTRQGSPVVTLSSDTGISMATIDGNGNFTFKPMAPGQYELLAVYTPDRARSRWAAFQTITVDRDISDLYPNPSSLPTVQFAFVDTAGRPVTMPEGSVMVRRKDPAAEGNVEVVKTSGGITLLPGRWEVALKPAATQCAVGFEPADFAGRADGWNEILLSPGARTIARFVLSLTPATIGGTVKNANGDAVAGVPVFVEPYDLDPRKRIEPMRWASTDAAGHYQIGGLAAGVYRLLASFDYQMPESAQMEAANAKTIRVEDGARATLDLEEFVIH